MIRRKEISQISLLAFPSSIRYENPIIRYFRPLEKKRKKEEGKGKANAKPCKNREVVLSVGTFRAIKPIVRKYRKIEACWERERERGRELDGELCECYTFGVHLITSTARIYRFRLRYIIEPFKSVPRSIQDPIATICCSSYRVARARNVNLLYADKLLRPSYGR